MKRIFPLLLALSLFAGCAQRYDLTMTNGMKLSGITKPIYHKETGEYFFKDAQGHTLAAKRSHVVLIEPHGSSGDNFQDKSDVPFKSSASK